MPFNTLIVWPVTHGAFVREITPFRVGQIFATFGMVKYIYVLPQPEPSFDQYGENLAYIQFIDEKVARKALRAVVNGKVRYEEKILRGRALLCKRPHIDKIGNKCLKKIFSFLDRASLLKVEQVCSKWRMLAEQIWENIKMLSLHPAETIDKRCYFSRCNRYLRSYSGPIDCINDVISLGRFPYLTDLVIQFDREVFSDFPEKGRLFNFPNLRRVVIELDFEKHHILCWTRCSCSPLIKFEFLNYIPEIAVEIHIHNISLKSRDSSFLSPMDLRKFHQLRALALCNWNLKEVTLMGIENLTNLEYLQIDKCQLNEYQMDAILNFKELKNLSLAGVTMSSGHLTKLLEHNPKLEYLNVEDVPITEQIFDCISNLEELKFLKFSQLPTVVEHTGFKNLECLVYSGESINSLTEFLRQSCNIRVAYTAESIPKDSIDLISNSRTNGVTLHVYDKEESSETRQYLFNKQEYGLCWPNKSKWYTSIDDNPVVRPLNQSCPIANLPNKILQSIFSFLPPQDILTLRDVCLRWKRVSYHAWKNVTYLDIGQIAHPTDKRKCISHCGRNLKELHCDNSYVLPLVRKQCLQIEKVAIRFRNQTKVPNRIAIRKNSRRFRNPYQCSTANQRVDDAQTCERQLLMGLKKLTHLKLDINDKRYTYFYFLQYLPAAMIEVHLLQGSEALVDLTKLVNLQALTLNGFHFKEGSLVGIGNLKKLVFLNLDNCEFVINGMTKQLESLSNLEFLSMQALTLTTDDLWMILRRNPGLKVLRLSLAQEKTFQNVKLMQLENLQFISASLFHILKIIDQVPQLKILYAQKYSKDFEEFDQLQNSRSIKIGFGEGMEEAAVKLHDVLPNAVIVNAWAEKEIGIFSTNNWIIKNKYVSSCVKSLRGTYSPVSKLTDDCLAYIFSYLPMRTRYDVILVCKRWRNVSKSLGLGKYFDIREFSEHENVRKYIGQFGGRRLRDVYYYNGCGLSVIEKNCLKIERLAIDFQFRCCRCLPYEQQKDRYNIDRVPLILAKFQHLTCLMLKGANFFYSQELWEELPKCLQELHIFNDNSKRSRTTSYGIFLEMHSGIDLSRYEDLRALTLIECRDILDFNFIGLNKLTKLIYLRIAGITSTNKLLEPLSNLSRLEYLSLSNVNLYKNDLILLIKNNPDLLYLNIEDCPILRNEFFLVVSDLKKLQYLRIHKIDKSLNLNFQPGKLINLQFMDFESEFDWRLDSFYNSIAGMVNLKMMRINRLNKLMIERVINAAENNILNRLNDSSLKIYLGRDGLEESSNFQICTPQISISDIPPNDYYVLLERDYWSGWCRRGGKSLIPNFVDDIKRRIDYQ